MQTLKSQIPIKTPNSRSKRKPFSRQKLAKIKEKSFILAQNLKIFPFTPFPQTIVSASLHEKVLRELNLWDFANLKLDFEIKKHFLLEFIAYYDSSKHSSYVGGQRISLTRADLSKALSLPSRNHKFANLEFSAAEFGGSDKVSHILWKLIFNKIVFLEDASILPDEVANATSLVKAGSPNKVDWAGLILFLIENEILDAPSSGYCHYAAHLQCLMKFQKPRLFEELESKELEPSEATVAEDDCVVEAVAGGFSVDKCGTMLSLGINVDSEMKKSEDQYDFGSLQCDGEKEMGVDLNKKDNNMDKMVDLLHAEEQDNGEKVEDTSKHDFIDSNKLTKGGTEMGKTVTDVMNVELGREEDHAMNFELGSLNSNDDDKGTIANDVMDVQIFGLTEGSNGKTEVDEGKFPNFDRLISSDFLQVMETNNKLSLNESIDHLNRDDLSIGRNMHMNLELGQRGSFYFVNEHKRCYEKTNHHVDEFHHKRFRSDQPMEQTPTITTLNQLSEELQHQMEKIKMDVTEKERQYTDITMQVQHAHKMLQSKDEIIQKIESSRMEAMRKRQLEASRFDHDLKHLSNIFYGCQKALKETENRFSEYRAKYPVGGKKCDNVLDVEDSKQCLEEDKKMHQFQSMIPDIRKVWLEKFDNLGKSLGKPMEKLVTIKEQVESLKESVAEANNETLD